MEQQNTRWDTACSAVWQHWDFLGGGVTLHCIQTSLFHDEGSDLGPLQWKQCVDHWTAREFPTLGLFQQRQCRGWGHLWAHGGCRQRLG